MAQKAIEKSEETLKAIEKQLESLKEVARLKFQESKNHPSNWGYTGDLTFIKEKLDDLFEMQEFYFEDGLGEDEDEFINCSGCPGPDEVDCQVGYTCMAQE